MDNLDLKQTIKTGSGGQSLLPSLSPGDTLGQYRIIRLLGRGGMGEVYLAENTVTRKEFALKILPRVTSGASFVDRFRVEARVMMDLNHPHIVPVYHAGEENGIYYLTMEYSEGIPTDDGRRMVTLEDYLTECGGKLPESRVREIAIQLCDALAYAHGRNVVHRDLKPANILLFASSKSNTQSPMTGMTAKIADFGLAKIVNSDYLKGMVAKSMQVSIGDQNTGSAKNSSGRSILGTYEFMSPEQKAGGDVGPTSDLYALGVILYRLLIGEQPEGTYEKPSSFGVSYSWDPIMDRCLKRNPAQRYQSAEELLVALAGKRKSVLPRILASVAAIVIAIVVFWGFRFSNQPSPISMSAKPIRTVVPLVIERKGGDPSAQDIASLPAPAMATQPAQSPVPVLVTKGSGEAVDPLRECQLLADGRLRVVVVGPAPDVAKGRRIVVQAAADQFREWAGKQNRVVTDTTAFHLLNNLTPSIESGNELKDKTLRRYSYVIPKEKLP